jgi:hypothetical protein
MEDVGRGAVFSVEGAEVGLSCVEVVDGVVALFVVVVLGGGVLVSVDVLDGVELFCSDRAVAVLDSFVDDTFVFDEELVEDALDIVVVDVAKRFAADWTALAAATDEDSPTQDVCGQPVYAIPSGVGAQREDIWVALIIS